MKSSQPILFSLLLLALLALDAQAEPSEVASSATFDQLVDAALSENPQLRSMRAKWEAAKQKAPQARAFPDPMFGVDIERMGTARLDKYSDTAWMVSQKLPGFGKRAARMQVAELEAAVVGYQYIELMRKVQAQVEAAYWELWLAREQVRLMTANRSLMEQIQKAATARYETGATTQADVLRAQAELAKMTSALVTMEQEIGVAESNLNRLLNAPIGSARATPTLELQNLTLTLDQLLERSRQFCCILIAFAYAQKAKEAALQEAKLEQRPDFELRVEARQFNGQSGIREYDTGIFMNVPWPWRGKYKAAIEQAEEEVKMAAAEFQDEVNTTLQEIKEDYTKAEAAMRDVQLYEKTLLPQARQLIESVQASYETGKATMIELLEAQRTLRDFKKDHARARAEYAKTVAQLNRNIAPWSEREFATGLPIPDKK